jgi:hypothetical protein
MILIYYPDTGLLKLRRGAAPDRTRSTAFAETILGATDSSLPGDRDLTAPEPGFAFAETGDHFEWARPVMVEYCGDRSRTDYRIHRRDLVASDRGPGFLEARA